LSPVVALLLTVSLSVLVVAAGLGEKVAVTPFGNSELNSFTLPLNPPEAVTEIVLVPFDSMVPGGGLEPPRPVRVCGF
jgi:hypothetical protein